MVTPAVQPQSPTVRGFFKDRIPPLFLPAQGFSAVVLEENQSLSTGSGLFDRRCGLKDAKFASQNKEKSPFRSTTAMVLTMRSFSVADGLFCREIDGLFCRSSPDIIVRRRCVLSHKRRGWLQPSPSFRYSRNLALQDELYHPVINNGPAVLVCVDKRLGTGPVNQSRDAG